MPKKNRSTHENPPIQRHPVVRRCLDRIQDDAIAQLTLDLALRADALLDDIPLTRAQRAQLHAFDRTRMPFVITRTCEALEGAPALYPEAPPPNLLRRRLGSAHRLHSLRSLLGHLHDRVERLYLLTQGEATALTLETLRGVREGTVRGLSKQEQRDREEGMFLAEHALHVSGRRRPRGRPRKKQRPA